MTDDEFAYRIQELFAESKRNYEQLHTDAQREQEEFERAWDKRYLEVAELERMFRL